MGTTDKGQLPVSRQTGRVRFQDLHCDLGRVVDMSAEGVGLIARSSMSDRIGTMIGFKVSAPWCEPFVLGGEVRYSKRLGFRKHHIGIAFVNLPPQTRARLNELAAGAGTREYGWGSK